MRFARVLVLLLSLFTVGSAFHSRSVPATRSGAVGRGTSSVPVIVELFTSEGCSSCPPADALLAKLEEQQPVANALIVALEEHVDYWNSLGWTDPFSAREWTTRQQDYAASLGNGNVYTPQMVVNGHTEFVGSRADEAQQAILREAVGQPKAEISMVLRAAEKKDREQFTVSVGKLVGNKSGDTFEVWLAITEAGLHSAVTRGENAGQDLHHASIVRALRKIGNVDQSKELSFSGGLSVPIDREWNRQNLRVVVFVQGKRSRQILGAAVARIEG